MPDGITRQFPGGGRGPVAMSDFGGRRGPPRWSAQLGPGLRRSTGVGGFGFDAWPGGDAGGEGRVSTRAAGLLSDGNPTSVPRRGPGPSWHVGFWRTPRAATMVRPTGPPAFAGVLGWEGSASTHGPAAMLPGKGASARGLLDWCRTGIIRQYPGGGRGPSRHVGFWRMPGGRHDGSPDWAPAFAGELGRVCAALTHDRAAMLARNVASAQNPPGLLSDGKQATVPRRQAPGATVRCWTVPPVRRDNAPNRATALARKPENGSARHPVPGTAHLPHGWPARIDRQCRSRHRDAGVFRLPDRGRGADRAGVATGGRACCCW